MKNYSFLPIPTKLFVVTRLNLKFENKQLSNTVSKQKKREIESKKNGKENLKINPLPPLFLFNLN